jgi:DNA-binding transcriptional MerR regulator
MQNDQQRRLVSIGVVSQAVGVPPSTIRDWEKAGLLPQPARVQDGTLDRRCYSLDDIELIRMTASARRRQQRQRQSA